MYSGSGKKNLKPPRKMFRGPCRRGENTICSLLCQRVAVLITVLSSILGFFCLLFGVVSEPRLDLRIDIRMLQSSFASWTSAITFSGAILCFILPNCFHKTANYIDEFLPCSARTAKKKVQVENDNDESNLAVNKKVLNTARLRRNVTSNSIDTTSQKEHPESDFQILLTELESSSKSRGVFGVCRMLALRWQTDHFSADALYTGFCASAWCFGLSAPLCTLVFERSIWRGRDQVIAYLLVTMFISIVLAVVCISSIITSGIGAIITQKRKTNKAEFISTLQISCLPLLASGCSSLLFLVLHIDNGGEISFNPF